MAQFLHKYENLKQIESDHWKIHNWFIADLPIEKRVEEVKNQSYFKKLLTKGQKEFTFISSNEVISWLDTLTILKRLISENKIHDKIKERLTAFQEYKIRFSRNYRCDYLLTLGNKILILEFSYSNEKEKYDEKLYQVIRYKELLSCQLSKDTEVAIYVYIYKPEKEYSNGMGSKEILENINYNKKENENLADFINLFFNQESAIKELESL